MGDLTINVLEEMRVVDVFEPSEDVPSVSPGTGFEELRRLVLDSHASTVPVLDGEGQLTGLVTAEQLRPVMDERQLATFVVAGDICAAPFYVHRDDDLYRAHELFRASGCPQIPVMESDGADPVLRIVGMIDYRDMMRAYGRELARRREDVQ